MITKKTFCFFIIFIICASYYQINIQAQSLPLGSLVLEDYYRRAQLMGEVDANISFVSRPLFSSNLINVENIYDPTFTLDKNKSRKFGGKLRIKNNNGIVKLLPISIYQQFNSHHPEGINDGAMIPSRGYQSLVNVGVYGKIGPLSIQWQPEFIFAENKSFEGFQEGYINPLELIYPSSPHTNIDYPERFGENSLNKLLWGQSSIRLTFESISFGLSNENLWWGPGIRNSLLMTNSAPGFKHITFNTVQPVKTPIGLFEWQIIAGQLKGSNYTAGLPDDWRYINAMLISYQPKWVSGLFLGLIRSFTVYHNDMGNSLNDYLPIIIPFRKNIAGDSDDGGKRRNQIVSIFMRWVFPKSHAEIYVEYGREDHAWDLRDFTVQAAHSSAYILGFQKLIPLNKYKDQYIRINAELTQLGANQSTLNRPGGDWYTHYQIKHGYTHQGQILGAGIGPGSNLQSLNISWAQSLKMIGIQFERYVHNNDFYQMYVKDIRENWVDLSLSTFATWNYKNLLFNFNLKFVKSFNYQWIYEPNLNDPSSFWNGNGWDVFNFQAQLGITYRF